MNVYQRTSCAFIVLVTILIPVMAQGATLDLSGRSNAHVGDTFSEALLVSSADQAINAVSSTISFPANLLSVVSASRAGSILPLWVQDPTVSNAAGTIDLSGLVPNPGWSGTGGEIVSIVFRALKEGDAQISFSAASVLANDGNGTDILTASHPANISIAAAPAPSASPSQTTAVKPAADLLAIITSPSHPDQTKWYAQKHVVLDWTLGANATEVRVGADQDPAGQPTMLYNTPISHKEIDLDDGVWYFHVEEKGGGVWGSVSTYKLQIDTQPPYSLNIAFPNGTTTSGSTIAVKLSASDDGSGIDHYDLSVDGRSSIVSAEQAQNDVFIPAPQGAHTLTVTAFDKAGNAATGTAQFISNYVSVQNEQPLMSSGQFFLIFALDLAALLAFWLLFFSKSKFAMRESLPDSNRVIHLEFLSLHEQLTNEIAALERTRQKRALTEDEDESLKRLRRFMDLERQLTNEITILESVRTKRNLALIEERWLKRFWRLLRR